MVRYILDKKTEDTIYDVIVSNVALAIITTHKYMTPFTCDTFRLKHFALLQMKIRWKKVAATEKQQASNNDQLGQSSVSMVITMQTSEEEKKKPNKQMSMCMHVVIRQYVCVCECDTCERWNRRRQQSHSFDWFVST